MEETNFSEVISFHRQDAKMSRRELAALSGVGKTAIYDVENGKETVRLSTVLALAKALNIQINFTSPLMDKYEESHRQDTK